MPSLEEFRRKVLNHAEHIKSVAHLCTNEETTKQALILPLLDILGFSSNDPRKLRAEFRADLPAVKAGERVDYALFKNDSPIIFVEAKAYGVALEKYYPQLMRYFNAIPEVGYGIITNGTKWLFSTDLVYPNILDDEPFFILDMTKPLSAKDIEFLSLFHYENYERSKIREFAEMGDNLKKFLEIIKKDLEKPDLDFVKYLANRANINNKFTTNFLQSLKPLVEEACQIITSKKPLPTLTQRGDILEILQDILPEAALILEKDEKNQTITVHFDELSGEILCRYYLESSELEFPLRLEREDVENVLLCGLAVNGNRIILKKLSNLARISFMLRILYLRTHPQN